MGAIAKPRRLRIGDNVAVVSPSWGGPAVFPHIYEAGIKFLRENNLVIKEYPSTRSGPKELYENPRLRAEDINRAYSDPDVKAIFSTIGGEDSVRILPYLDIEAIKSNPKMIMGYSDSTTFLSYINQMGHVTFNGPSVMAGMGQLHNFPKAIKQFKQILFEVNETYTYRPFKVYSEGYPEWGLVENTGKVNTLKSEMRGWKWLNGEIKSQGELFGGCVDVLEMMKGTDYWPDNSFWKEKILFLETSEDKTPPNRVKMHLRNYGMMGILDSVVGLLFGRSRGYTDEEKERLDEAIIEVVVKEFGNRELSVVSNLDFGHTDPQFILPLGVKMEINPSKKTLTLCESPTID